MQSGISGICTTASILRRLLLIGKQQHRYNGGPFFTLLGNGFFFCSCKRAVLLLQSFHMTKEDLEQIGKVIETKLEAGKSFSYA